MGTSVTSVRRGLLGHARRELVSAPTLDHDERDAVDDERGSDDPRVVEVLLHEVVQRNADNRRRQAAHDDLAPQTPGVAALLARLAKPKRQQVTDEQHAHGQDRAKLNHHEEHVPELFGHVELDELVHQDHVAGRRDGQPFRNALHNAKEYGL